MSIYSQLRRDEETIKKTASILDTMAAERLLGENAIEDTHWLNADDMADNAKAPIYLINNIIESKTHGLIAGSSQSFKSFCVLKMAHSICTGKDFFSNDVYEQGKVIYICGEGLGALGRRIKALKIVDGDFMGNLQILNKPMFIDNIAEMQWLSEAIARINPVLVIFDTFSSLATSTKENANEEVARALKMVSDCCNGTGSSSIVVHHYGKDTEKGMRGASAFSANVDFEISMTRTIGTMEAVMSCKKSKDGDFFDDIEILAHIVDLGLVRQDGSSTSSLVLKSSKHDVGLTIHQQRAFDAIKDCLIEHGAFLNGFNVVTREQVKKCLINEFKDHAGRYAIFDKVVPALIKKGVLQFNDNGYFIEKKKPT